MLRRAFPARTVMSKAERELDVVLWGASGFTGALTAEYLTRRYGGDLRYALAGRDQAKLESLRDDLTIIDPSAASLPILIGDGLDRSSLDPIVGRTRVMCTTVGPYLKYGADLVASCVEQGTDYCDLAGEIPFMRAMIDRHHDRARETGARIVHCCGFDSIPSDLGVLMMQEEMKERHGVVCDEVRLYVTGSRGQASGGTVASLLNLADEVEKDRSMRKLLANPNALLPRSDGTAPAEPEQRGVLYDDRIGAWTAPFIMSRINTRVVRRSNALMGYAYGESFEYTEAMAFGGSVPGFFASAAIAAGVGLIDGFVRVGPLRRLLGRTVLPKPGQGPSREQMEEGYFRMRLLGRSTLEDGTTVELSGRVGGDNDPGYRDTATMLAESAVCLARDELASDGGVITPAVAMGMRLVERLRKAGIMFEVADS